MEKLKVEVKRLHPEAKIPSYAYLGMSGDLGADLFALSAVVIHAQGRETIQTGIAIAPPLGYGAIIEGRSGLSQRGVTVLGGVIDSGYRGEIKVVLGNLSDMPISISSGERIAQLRFVRRFEAEFVVVDEIPSSDRDVKGFGSSGNL